MPHDGLDLSSGGHKGRASNLGARSLKVKKNVFFHFTKNPLHRFLGKILVLDHQQNSGKTAENVLKLILLLIKSGFVERKCVILLLCCVIW